MQTLEISVTKVTLFPFGKFSAGKLMLFSACGKRLVGVEALILYSVDHLSPSSNVASKAVLSPCSADTVSVPAFDYHQRSRKGT